MQVCKCAGSCVFVCVSVAEHLIAQHSAIKMLHSRVKVILEYVKAVQAGESLSLSHTHTHLTLWL